ncbi:FBD-associated F-box protein At5g60610-like [Lotus japonicus]|uniref:FBD-associated F-box protein At5g60610-like n=1 Tax=Lotus japonicus TaxID=34305 RepID=UPI00258D81F4|nr:FBD-associated F-box protein At5g60610-like [Lotus japonicus]
MLKKISGSATGGDRNMVDVDVISTLPDELLYHILSFLPTKQALATGVLSKRWANLPRPLQVLHLDEDGSNPTRCRSFISLVDTLMLSHHNQHISITSLHLKYNGSSHLLSRFKLDQWMAAAKQRHIQDLTLSLPSFHLPPCILTSQTLVLLDLTSLFIQPSSSVHLPSLKTLRLQQITFDSPHDPLRLLSLCPVLEDFHAAHFYFRQHDHATYFTPLPNKNLIKANIFSTTHLPLPMSAFLNLEFLDITKGTFNGDAFPTFNNLIHLNIYETSFRGWDLAVHVLQKCPKLQILNMRTGQREEDWIFDWGYEGPNREDWEYPAYVPECVSSHLRIISLSDYGGWEDDLRFAAYILQKARVLQVMTIHCFDMCYCNSYHRRLVEILSSYPKISHACELSVVTKGNKENEASPWWAPDRPFMFIAASLYFLYLVQR